MEAKRMRFLVLGKVQGVSFRYYTAREAGRMGLGGWVRNLPDGSVEVFAQGPADEVDYLFKWAHHGPEFASVKGVRLIEEEFVSARDGRTGEFDLPVTFEIRY